MFPEVIFPSQPQFSRTGLLTLSLVSAAVEVGLSSEPPTPFRATWSGRLTNTFHDADKHDVSRRAAEGQLDKVKVSP